MAIIRMAAKPGDFPANPAIVSYMSLANVFTFLRADSKLKLSVIIFLTSVGILSKILAPVVRFMRFVKLMIDPVIAPAHSGSAPVIMRKEV